MKKSAAKLVEFAKNKLGTNYVYGMKGVKMTLGQYNNLKKLYPSIVRDTDRKKVGTICVDCSGLISWFTGKIKNSTSFKESATKVLSIKEINKADIGCALWRKGHIGIYIGNGYCVEARGSAYGVVRTKVSERDFTHILWIDDIDYTKGSTDENENKTSAAKTYKVKAGDNLTKIARQFNTTVDKLATLNGIKNKNLIKVGQVLRIG